MTNSPNNPIFMFQEFIKLYAQTAREAFKFPWRGKEILKATAEIGMGSLPIITIATTFAGIVVTNEIAWHMKKALFTVTMTPGFSGQFVIRELGIAIPALLMVAKVGASISAEIGTMKVTEQIDALKLLQIRPLSYLVFPRWLACIFSLTCLTLLSISVTLVCGMLVSVMRHGFNALEYWVIFKKFVGMEDLFVALVKSSLFGSVIPIISCAYGFHCERGAQGVGNATTNAVVASTIAVIVLDFILTYLFSFVL